MQESRQPSVQPGPGPVELHPTRPVDADALEEVEREARGEINLAHAQALAARYLSRAAPARRAQAIADLLSADSELLQEAGLELATRMGPSVLSSLGDLLDSENWRVRWYALEVARHVDTADALPLLVRGLSDEDLSNRWVATHGLEMLGSIAFYPVLSALASREATIPFHRSARRVLEAVRPDQASPLLDALLEALDHETTLVQSKPLAVQLLNRERASRVG